MRWLICIAIVLAAGDALARKLVIMDPPMVRACPRAKTFNAMMSCLAKHGTAKLIREVKGAKLVQLTQPANRHAEIQLLLYVERKGEWQIGGLHRSYGTNEARLLDLQPVTVGKRIGYRLDLGQVTQITVVVDNVSTVPALARFRRSLFCSGDNYHCADATTECEVVVDGRTWHVFRGVLSIGENLVHVKGDRSRAGPNCAVPEKIYLGWAQN